MRRSRRPILCDCPGTVRVLFAPAAVPWPAPFAVSLALWRFQSGRRAPQTARWRACEWHRPALSTDVSERDCATGPPTRDRVHSRSRSDTRCRVSDRPDTDAVHPESALRRPARAASHHAGGCPRPAQRSQPRSCQEITSRPDELSEACSPVWRESHGQVSRGCNCL